MGISNEFHFTSESVSEGHPDKVCDQISDTIVDAYLGAYPESRVAAETLATTNRVIIAGEVRGPDSVTFDYIEHLVREKVREIGYEQSGFHWKHNEVTILLHQQSQDIAKGVDSGANKDEGAGDQGIMFGYATDETEAYMPAPILYAHNILRKISICRKSKLDGFDRLGPDAKSQVTVRYVNSVPVDISKIVLSIQHLDPDLTPNDIRSIVEPTVRSSVPDGAINDNTVWLVNPTGRFVIGGPDGDCGLTGRKVIVDTYGGAAPHGGGAFSGKDPTKVDRSASYAARYLAKNVVAAGLAKRATIQLAYAIGIAKPVSINVNLHDTGVVDERVLETTLMQMVDLTPRGIRLKFHLNRPIYAQTAAYGHFGREATPDGSFSWERLDLVHELRAAFSSCAVC